MTGGTTANPGQGLRLERIPGEPVRRTEAGRIGLPMRVLHDGAQLGEVALVMRHEEAVELFNELAAILGLDGDPT